MRVIIVFSGSMSNVLENLVWHSLIGHQSRFAEGYGEVRRYAQGFSPIVGFEDQSKPDFTLLDKYSSVGEAFYCEGWTGMAPSNWNIDLDSLMIKMVYEGERPINEEAEDIIKLGREHAKAALELAELTHPGPFGPRTMELGDYFGFIHGSRLVAMAGERMFAGAYREVSGVCTHPDFQGHGLARQLIHQLLRNALGRGEIPILHVMSDNIVARRLYSRLGFSDYHERAVRVVSRTT